jgi:hypothetical protein
MLQLLSVLRWEKGGGVEGKVGPIMQRGAKAIVGEGGGGAKLEEGAEGDGGGPGVGGSWAAGVWGGWAKMR